MLLRITPVFCRFMICLGHCMHLYMHGYSILSLAGILLTVYYQECTLLIVYTRPCTMLNKLQSVSHSLNHKKLHACMRCVSQSTVQFLSYVSPNSQLTDFTGICACRFTVYMRYVRSQLVVHYIARPGILYEPKYAFCMHVFSCDSLSPCCI